MKDNGVRAIGIREEQIELCQLLKFAGFADTGGEAKHVISQGLVTVNGGIETRKRRKLVIGDRITFGDQCVVIAVGTMEKN